ncbi:MAG TPA: DUF106 domain-containing protein [Candidatus Bathyarchaeota archaeon]|nr:MAG: hypothetical protein DRO34_03610 [Candidatus Bathyarchaeota archaeon]HDI07579.1 DUF106 domain-containing protein [Candidatus Bathyarchaeota archaeon]
MLPEFLSSIPAATFFILALSMVLTFLTSLANRLLTNPEKTREWRKEIAEWNAEFRKAQKTGDKKLLEKVMKRQKYILQLQSKMMWQSMKLFILFSVPFFLLWQVLLGFYGIRPVAYFPGVSDVNQIIDLGFMKFPSIVWWYFLCSTLFGTVFSRLLGITAEAEN